MPDGIVAEIGIAACEESHRPPKNVCSQTSVWALEPVLIEEIVSFPRPISPALG